jgi:hypothetical protein
MFHSKQQQTTRSPVGATNELEDLYLLLFHFLNIQIHSYLIRTFENRRFLDIFIATGYTVVSRLTTHLYRYWLHGRIATDYTPLSLLATRVGEGTPNVFLRTSLMSVSQFRRSVLRVEKVGGTY